MQSLLAPSARFARQCQRSAGSSLLARSQQLGALPHPAFSVLGATARYNGSAVEPHLGQYRAFLLDMDGVLHRHGNLVPGADAFLDDLLNSSVPFTIITNECRYTGDALQEKLQHILGVKIPLGQIYTAGNACRDFFARSVRKGWKGNVFVIGEEGLVENVREAFKDSECRVITGQNYDGEHCDFVCIGTVITGGPNDKWTNAETASTLIRNGAKLLYTNPDWGEVTAEGSFKFGCPAPIIKLLTQTTGCSAYNLGKPNPFGLRRAHGQLVSALLAPLTPAQRSFVQGDIDFSDVLFVGDSIDTDIRVAIENGIDSALVLSGTTTMAKLKSSALRPNWVFDCVSALHDEFKRGGLLKGGTNFTADAWRSGSSSLWEPFGDSQDWNAQQKQVEEQWCKVDAQIDAGQGEVAQAK